jgi:hypothetical protein
MEDEILNNLKMKHSTRLHQKQNHINRQVQIAKDYHMHKNMKWKSLDEPHRNHKTAILNCGDPKCVMCMNPRKAFGEKTMQEKKFEQKKLHEGDLE